MGSFANSLFSLLLGWVQMVVSSIWSFMTQSTQESFLIWLRDYWIPVVLILCMTGLIIDFLVYLFRWKPHLVWLSFFQRIRGRKKHSVADDIQQNVRIAADLDSHESKKQPSSLLRSQQIRDNSVSEEETSVSFDQSQPESTDDLARWKTPDDHESFKSEITSAGYSVPLDSPYRRPSIAQNDQMEEPSFKEKTARDLLSNRSRARMIDWFGEEQDVFTHVKSPQELIDRNQAYRKPVYPRKWRTNREISKDEE